jgi:hypothetical protein
MKTQVLNRPYGELAPYFLFSCNTVGGNVILYIHTTPIPPGFEVHHLTPTSPPRQSCNEIDVIYFNPQWFPIDIEGLCIQITKFSSI